MQWKILDCGSRVLSLTHCARPRTGHMNHNRAQYSFSINRCVAAYRLLVAFFLRSNVQYCVIESLNLYCSVWITRKLVTRVQCKCTLYIQYSLSFVQRSFRNLISCGSALRILVKWTYTHSLTHSLSLSLSLSHSPIDSRLLILYYWLLIWLVMHMIAIALERTRTRMEMESAAIHCESTRVAGHEHRVGQVRGRGGGDGHEHRDRQDPRPDGGHQGREDAAPAEARAVRPAALQGALLLLPRDLLLLLLYQNQHYRAAMAAY